MYKKSQIKKGFTITELIIAIVIIAVLSSVAYIGIQKTMGLFKNNRVSNDLIAIQTSLQQYFDDNSRMFPLPEPNGNMNILCFDSDASYAHDCDTASFRQGVIDNSLLTKRYLPEVPTDPWTDRTYAYGVTNDRKYFMIAGLQQNSDGTFSAFTITNIQRGFHLPSLIRSYSSRNFVTNSGQYLPYSPEYNSISAQLEDPPMDVTVTDDEGTPKFLDETLYPGDIVTTGGTPVNIYFSDGSFSRLEANSTLQILDTSSVDKNDDDNIITKIKLKLFNGKIWNKVVRLAQKSEFNIETTSAIAGVRGTEFAVCNNDPVLCPGTEKIIVQSGSVDVQKIDEKGIPVGITVTADAEFKPVYIDVGGDIEITETDIKEVENYSEEEDYIETSSAPLLHSGIFPYITGFDILQKDNGYFIVRIGMNGFKAEDYENIQGFQVLNKDHFFNEFAERDIRPEIARCLKEAMYPGDCDGIKAVDINHGIIEITAPYQAMYDTENKVYLLSWPLPPLMDNRYKQDGLVLKAYEYAEYGKHVYSDFSWPSVGFNIMKIDIETKDLIVDFTKSSMYDKVAGTDECRIKFISPATSPAGNMPLNPEFIWKPMPGCDDVDRYDFEFSRLAETGIIIYSGSLENPVFSSDEHTGFTGVLEPSVNYQLKLTAFNKDDETVIKKTLAFKTKNVECIDGEIDSMSCSITNGDGLQSMICVGNVWETSDICAVTSCDAGYVKNEDSTACILDTPPTLAELCDETNMLYDGENDKCWVLGKLGDSCTDVCNAIDGSETYEGIDCLDVKWDDTASCEKCKMLTGKGEATCAVNEAEFAPFYTSSPVPQCLYHSMSSAVCMAKDIYAQRICRCEPN